MGTFKLTAAEMSVQFFQLRSTGWYKKCLQFYFKCNSGYSVLYTGVYRSLKKFKDVYKSFQEFLRVSRGFQEFPGNYRIFLEFLGVCRSLHELRVN